MYVICTLIAQSAYKLKKRSNFDDQIALTLNTLSQSLSAPVEHTCPPHK